jgi:hypothetical protein
LWGAVEAQTDQPPFERQRVHPLERTLAHERFLLTRHRPAQPEFRGVIVRHRVLRQIDVSLLEPEHVERVEAMRADVPRLAGSEQGIPQPFAPAAG